MQKRVGFLPDALCPSRTVKYTCSVVEESVQENCGACMSCVLMYSVLTITCCKLRSAPKRATCMPMHQHVFPPRCVELHCFSTHSTHCTDDARSLQPAKGSMHRPMAIFNSYYMHLRMFLSSYKTIPPPYININPLRVASACKYAMHDCLVVAVLPVVSACKYAMHD